MKKEKMQPTKAPDLQPTTNNLESLVNQLAEKVATLVGAVATARTVAEEAAQAAKLNTASLVNLTNIVEDLAGGAVLPSGFQAIVVDQMGRVMIVFGEADANSDGFTSVPEAIEAAKSFIQRNRLADTCFPSVFPVYQ